MRHNWFLAANRPHRPCPRYMSMVRHADDVWTYACLLCGHDPVRPFATRDVAIDDYLAHATSGAHAGLTS